MIKMSVERRVFIIDWDKFLNYARDCRGQGIFFTNEETKEIKAVVGKFGAEISFDNDKDYQKALKQLEELEFVRVYDVKDATVWLIR